MSEIPPPTQQDDDQQQLSLPVFTPPIAGEKITSEFTRNTYTIGGRIGEGSFGVVYACTDSWNNELAAKILKPRSKPYETIKQDAINEFQKLLTLRHPFITFVFDAFEFRDTFYIVTERCHRPVKDLFEIDNYDGSIWVEPVARCLLQAIHFVHLNGFAHQDIHLGNVFTSLVKDELIPQDHQIMMFKLGDLGITKLIGDMDAENTLLADWILPPEYFDVNEFGPLDHRMDLYHCGLLLLQILVGKELHFTKDEILAGKPRQMALGLSTKYRVALEKALRRHVEKRTQSAMELWRDLNTPEIDAQDQHSQQL